MMQWCRRCAAALAVLTVLGGSAYAQQPDEGLAQGRQVFEAQRCALCHSVDGVGNKRGALDDVGARLSKDMIREWLLDPDGMRAQTGAQRRPPMRAPRLSTPELTALVEYLSTLRADIAD